MSALQVVFAGFSAESLAQRILDCKPKVVITCNAVRRGPKVIHLKEIVDSALTECAKYGVSVGEPANACPVTKCTRYVYAMIRAHLPNHCTVNLQQITAGIFFIATVMVFKA